MQRRQFMGYAAAALAAGVCGGPSSPAFAGDARHAAKQAAKSAKPLDAAQYHASRRFAKTRFGEIAYIERGSGPAVLFLHGLPLNSFQWRGAIDRLAPHRRCIAPDFMGMGYTRVAEGQSVAPSAQTDMLAALLDRLKIGEVDLISNDSGDAVAQLFVARYPKRVRSLLLTNGDEERNCPPEVVKSSIAEAREGKSTDQFVIWLADKPSNRAAKGIGGQAFADPANFTDEAVEYYFRPLVSSARSKALFDAFLVGLLPNPLEGIGPALKRFQGPVRIVWGTADTIFLPENPDRLDRAFGNSRGVRRLPGYKLFWPEERPDVIAEEALALWGISG